MPPAACSQVLPAFPEGASGSLPEVLYRLLDPAAAVDLPPPGVVHLRGERSGLMCRLAAGPAGRKCGLPPAAVAHCLPYSAAFKTAESDNRELDKLVAALGRNKATWRRALQLH